MGKVYINYILNIKSIKYTVYDLVVQSFKVFLNTLGIKNN